GMAYLLIPPYVGQTLMDRRFAALHFVLTVGALILLIANSVIENSWMSGLGALLWSLGVLVFVVSITLTVVPSVWERIFSGEGWGGGSGGG
ncbi:MAG: hypothetical protein SXQ77_02310, partial [Halobacteria archaeon]|nr:hypothetical protein [Halobacteria archaeon]